MSVTTTVLVHCLAPSESSTHVNGQSHLCIVRNAGDDNWKLTVTPTTVPSSDIGPSNGVTAQIGVVESGFVEAQPQVLSTLAARCWSSNIVVSAVVHNLGWVE